MTETLEVGFLKKRNGEEFYPRATWDGVDNKPDLITQEALTDAYQKSDLYQLMQSGTIRKMLDLENTFLSSLSDYAKKSDLPDLTQYAKESELANYATNQDLQTAINDVKALTVLASPDGQKWLLSVNNDGLLSTSKLTVKEQS